VHCLLSFRKANNNKGTAYINDFTGSKEFTKADKLLFAKSEDLKTPMNGNIAAFTDEAALNTFMQAHTAQKVAWSEVEKEFMK
jgi:copper chaperone NosL